LFVDATSSDVFPMRSTVAEVLTTQKEKEKEKEKGK